MGTLVRQTRRPNLDVSRVERAGSWYGTARRPRATIVMFTWTGLETWSDTVTMFQNYRGCWVRSTPRDDARRGGYSYEVVIVVHKRSLPLQVRHKYRGRPFPAILEAQKEGLRWAIAAINDGRVAANID